MNNLGILLRELRGKQSLREIARITKLSHTYISDLEKGIRRDTRAQIQPSVEILKKLAEAYGYPYENLLMAAGYIGKTGIGERIKIQRKHLKLTQEELSKLVKVSSQVVSNWEREYSTPDSSDIQKLSDALQISADYLLNGKQPNHVLDKESSDWDNFGETLKEKGYSLNEIKSLIYRMIETFNV